MTIFEEINQKHQDLLLKQESGQDKSGLATEAQAFLQEMQRESAKIGAGREREQVRGIIRYWAAFIYDQTHMYPQTNLQPPDPSLAEGKAAKDQAKQRESNQDAYSLDRAEMRRKLDLSGLFSLRNIVIAVGLLLLLLVIISIGNYFTGGNIVMGFPTATPTPQATATLAGVVVPGTATTATEESPTGGQTSTGTPIHLPTSSLDRTSTPGPILTIHPATSTPLGTVNAGPATATRSPSLPETSVSIPFLGLTAEALSRPQDYACTPDIIRISAAGGSLSGGSLAKSWTEAVIQIKGMGEPGTLVEIKPSPAGETVISLSTSGARLENYYLLHVESAQFESLDLIFLYSKSCRQVEMKITFMLGMKEVKGTGLVQVGEVSLGWELLTWGPVPGAGVEGWAAQLRLVGTGGNQNYVYWETQEGKSIPLAGDEVLLTGEACQPGEKLIGVTSAGQTATRLLSILAPYCPRE